MVPKGIMQGWTGCSGPRWALLQISLDSPPAKGATWREASLVPEASCVQTRWVWASQNRVRAGSALAEPGRQRPGK